MTLGLQQTAIMAIALTAIACTPTWGQSPENVSSRRKAHPVATPAGANDAQLPAKAEPVEPVVPARDKLDLGTSSRRIPRTSTTIDTGAASVSAERSETGMTSPIEVVSAGAAVAIDTLPPVSQVPTVASEIELSGTTDATEDVLPGLNSVLQPIQQLPAEQTKPAADSAPQSADLGTAQPPEYRVATRPEPIMRRKPLPKLADPEQFLVTSPRYDASQFRAANVLRQQPNSGFGDRPIPPGMGGQGNDSWLDTLPVPTLDQNLKSNALQRASVNRSVKTFVNFATEASLAMDYRMNAYPTVKTWRSPNLSHRPIYFEDPQLERYGNGTGRWQPVVSGARFFTEVVFLPYQVGAKPPTDCVYEMGYARPGDCVPACRDRLEFSRRGFFFQSMTAAAIFGGL